MPIDRGIEYIDVAFDKFTEKIATRIQEQGHVSILEAGCGLGVAMMEFVKRFGDQISITGFNHTPGHGDEKRMIETCIEREIFTAEEIAQLSNLPEILFCDANELLPFEDNSFDFIYSFALMYLLDDKVHFLEECNRLLKKDGIACHEVKYKWPTAWAPNDPEYQAGWQIWDQGRLVPLKEYVARLEGVETNAVDKWANYVKFRKQDKLDFKLKFITAIDTSFLYKDWMGVKSIYTTQLEGVPYWKSGLYIDS